MYSTQGNIECIEDFYQDLVCFPTCKTDQDMLTGTKNCYPTKKVAPMNACLAKLPKKPVPTIYPAVNATRNNIFNSEFNAKMKECNNRFWSTKNGPGTPAVQTCIQG